MKKVYAIIFMIFSFGWVSSQYYYFDISSTSYPYQQGCAESLSVRLSTESNVDGTKAGRFHLVLDPQNISYSTSDVRNTLFQASTNTFLDWSSESSPSWKPGSNFTILQIDRKNNLNVYKGSNGLYGTVSFSPRYSSGLYSTVFGMEYNGEIGTPSSTIETTLSSPFGTEIINSTRQYLYMTGIYSIEQQPCVADTNNPSISINWPLNGSAKQSYLSGISLGLTDVGGSSANVPYVWTAGTVGIGVWTGNLWNLDQQYGIDISTFELSLAGNGQNISINGSSYTNQYGKTWQFLDKNYNINLPSNELFDYGIEKQINMDVSVRDRAGRFSSTSISFNHPHGPTLIPGTRSPVDNARFITYNAPVRLGIQDDWAGVDSGSIVVTLSGINGTNYGPYVFSGSTLSLSELASTALQPNWMTEISSHVSFPSSGTILVRVSVSDMEGNQGNISDYVFFTRPNCSDLGCGFDKTLYYKNNSLILYVNNLIVSGGINPSFYLLSDGTGYINCGLTNQGMVVYKGQEQDTGSAQSVGFVSSQFLSVMGNKIKAVLSGSTLTLEKLFDYGSLDGGGRGGGGVYLTKDDCPNGDDSPSYYDHTCEPGHGAAGDCPIDYNPSYSQELNGAYKFAYDIGITTICPIENANMGGQLLRKHMAKMLTEFAVVIVGLYPDLDKPGCDKYDDMKGQSSETIFYAKTVCQLSLMGLESNGIDPLKSFKPNDVVTRAQFGTILSRLIFSLTYNIKKGETVEWYAKHLQALKEHKIMNKIDQPFVPELRGWVMLMLQRTYQSGIINKYRLLNNSLNSVKVLYEF